ncbi:Fluoroquinolones export ATP-binding protein Rv2688c/MT2762 [Anaerococcus octavius]|jgi:ABC transporter related|uniref:Fluoroquinolones export ATP-binding protein Rv2688c/MT2762 n=1 Tax=Anaerococcus octavius TaxID=54007 RepID=A0A380WUV4_9FIRM|nr:MULTISPECIES: ATP-binding cassette domain-containing protein [Anaerococcus]MDU0894078.1 ATP-binding cassette domain-containing protein [Anaerococcus sp.]MDU7411168.1 ATP-binding cassette domain-containing protein [Anaerococcus sp.]SUU92837.1 Fluoroquinolones export ATP-binding protein Rv2688c/MT2762 [Anaerococcus octavius]
MNFVEIKNISKSFGDHIIFDDVSLSIDQGQCVGFIGENGVGKSVLFKMIAGLVEADKGQIYVKDQLVGRNENFPTNIGFFVNQPSFVDIFDGFENLKLLAEIKNSIDDKKIRDTMIAVGLDPDNKTKFKSYSTGMKQKLAIAQAIMEDQDLVLLDEPFNALDTKSNLEIINVINKLKEEDKTIFLTSHQEEYLRKLCNEIYLVNDNKIKRIDNKI